MQTNEPGYTSVYRKVLKGGYDESFEKGLEKGREELRKTLQPHLQQLRRAAFDVTLKRFPHLANLASDYARSLDDLYLLTRLVTRMATIPTVEGAEIFLEIMIEESKETK